MIRDITIGQFFPGESFIHKLDPRSKLILTVILIVEIFLCKNFYNLALMLVCSIAFVLISRISFKVILKGLRTVFIIILFTCILQLFYNNNGDVWLEWWKIKITSGGVYTAIFMAVRIFALILTSSLLTYTTSPTMLTDGMERVFSPLKLIHVPVGTLAMMMTIALRFIPTLIEEIGKIMNAQKARGADLETGGVVKRAKALVPIFVPLFVNSFRRAYELAFAMECRCYTGDNNRTRMRVMKLTWRDWVSIVFTAATLAGIIVLNIFFEAVV